MAYQPAGVHINVTVIGNRLNGSFQKQIRDAAKGAVRKHLEDVQQRWGNDVRVDSAELKESILEPSAIVVAPNGLEGTVGTDNDHAEVNEYGGPTIAARPSARQAGEAARPAFERDLAKLTKELER
jgi:hypothetical protein